MSTNNDGYDYPIQRGNETLRVPLGRDSGPVALERRELALAKLRAWGDLDVAVMLGLLPDGAIADLARRGGG